MSDRPRVSKVVGRFARTSDGRTLALPDSETRWQVRYALWHSLDSHRYAIASMLDMYAELVTAPEKERNELVRLIREGMAHLSKEEPVR